MANESLENYGNPQNEKIHKRLFRPSEGAIKEEKRKYKTKVEIIDIVLDKEIPDFIIEHIKNRLEEEYRYEVRRYETLAEQNKRIEIPRKKNLEDLLKKIIIQPIDSRSDTSEYQYLHGLIQGEIFEKFCEEQVRKNNLLVSSENKLSKEEKKELERISVAILDIIHNPEKYDIKLPSGRNSDIVGLALDKDMKIWIKTIYEAKSGTKLDARSMSQLSESGFVATLQKFIKLINESSSEKIKSLGLGQDGLQIDMDKEKVQQVLFLCEQVAPIADLSKDGKELEKLIDRQIPEVKKNEFINILKQVDIQSSYYRHNEVENIATDVLNRILSKSF